MSTSPIIRQIEQQLTELRKTEPPENGYATYKAFLNEMHLLAAYPFREKFLLQLIDLAYSCYTSKIRYNKEELFNRLKAYYSKSNPAKFIALPEDTVTKLFYIFEREGFKPNRISVPVNYLLKGQRLQETELSFLVKNAFVSELFLNRVLQYRFASDIILDWVKIYAKDERLSKRRMEVTSWLMDERLNARPPVSLLYDDLRLYFNQLQENEIYSCVRAMWKQGIWDRVAADPGYKIRSFNTRFVSLRGKDIYDSLSDELADHEYTGKLVFYALLQTGFYYTEKGFLEPVDLYQSRITTWAIAYSRLELPIKVNMLKHEYREELKSSYLHIARRLKSEDLLEWLLKVCKNRKQ